MTLYRNTVGDFDKNGKLDILTANGRDESISVLENTSSGSIHPHPGFMNDWRNSTGRSGAVGFQSGRAFDAGTEPTSMAQGPLNDDGQPDIVITSPLVGRRSLAEGRTGSTKRSWARS